MKLNVLAVAGLLVLAACGPSVRQPAVAQDQIFSEPERSPQKSGGYCGACNFEVYDGHRCGLTSPCSHCQRERGARHLHLVTWTCPVDGFVTSQVHECNDAKTCFTCRADKKSLLGTRGCERCYRQAPPTGVRGITTYCQECNLEVAANHLHGVTVMCRSCLREAGPGHKCDATRLCVEHRTEHDPLHVHGTTTYCHPCHRDAGVGHKHGTTEWCWACNAEMEWPHSFH